MGTLDEASGLLPPVAQDECRSPIDYRGGNQFRALDHDLLPCHQGFRAHSIVLLKRPLMSPKPQALAAARAPVSARARAGHHLKGGLPQIAAVTSLAAGNLFPKLLPPLAPKLG